MASLPKKTVLFVDEEQGWRVRVSDSLTKAGYDVQVAADVSEAGANFIAASQNLLEGSNDTSPN